MDLATIIGYLLAWGALGYGAYHASHGAIGAYIKPGEVLLVGGCALGATLASMPLHSVAGALKATKKMLLNKHAHLDHLIKDIVGYAETARRDGVLALETVARETPDKFLGRGLQLTIDGTDPEMIERIMRIEIDAMAERHKHGKHFWASLAKFGPGCGLVACLTAQVAMFRNLDGGAAVIGAALAVALVGTLYGALLQNLVAGPIAEKLGLLSKEEIFAKEIVLQGVLSIQAGNNPRVVEMQLLSFLDAKQQAAALKAAA
jgi:chemotaxis protein MotA